MKAADVMVRAVVTASPDTTVEGLAKLMINLRISGVPVLEKDGRLVGIVTEGDLLRRIETGTERHRPRWSEPFSSIHCWPANTSNRTPSEWPTS